MPTPIRILMVEDSEDDALLLIRTLKKNGYEPQARRVQTAEDMTAALTKESWDIILCDYHMPGFSGMEALALIKQINLDIPIIIVSGAIGEETALECIYRGADDYVMKGKLARLGIAITRVLEKRDMNLKQRQNEEALRQSEEKFKTIANYTVDWESWFGPDGKYIWVNPAVKRITGYTAEEVVAMPDFINILIAEEDRESVSRQFKRALTETWGENFEIRCIHKNGSLFWLSVSWQPVYDARGSFLGIRTSGRDITAAKQAAEERHNLEKQLFQAQKMEAMGALAGGIAHDFNNILSGIMGYAELTETEPDESIRKSNIQHILSATERARNLVRQILAFSHRVEQGKKPIELQSAVREALKLLRATIPSNIAMHQNMQDKPITILGDYTQVHQVIMNLCTNAAHAIGAKGGRIDIILAEEKLFTDPASAESEKPGHFARLSISDSGTGIAPAIIDRIFDPFFTTKKIGEGTGLGLSVVYGIIKNHDGSIRVESIPGKGTTFHIWLPCLKDQEAADAAVPPRPAPGGSESIMVVDDEEDLVDLMRQILSDLGYRVTACASSLDALKTFEADPDNFDLVITDMTMPAMTGSELAQQILKHRPGQRIILCTGHSSFIDAEKAADIGIRTFLLKPVTRRDLAATVRKVLDETFDENAVR